MIPLACVSYQCPDRESCAWRQKSFHELKAAAAAGRSRDCFQPGEVCPKTLHHALHSMSGAPERWARRKASGLTDAALAEAVGEEFGEWSGGSLGAGWTCMASGPKIWFGSAGDGKGGRRKPDLQGRALLDAVRELLDVSTTPQAQAPWAGLPLMQMMEARG